ncbi:MAG: ATP-dependent nuclease [Candidatus Helarchaeota archaeon]
MRIKKIKIENFKCFKIFELNLNKELNILVGNNESGKSTILEAIHLALTGLFRGRYIKNELTQYLFNNQVIKSYLDNIKQEPSIDLPYILIELYFDKDNEEEDHILALFKGNGNSEKAHESGISFKIAFDEKYQEEYNEFIKNKEIKTLPIEYYDIFWTSFARNNITARSIPLKPALIDSSSNRYQNGSDIYISRIIRENLEIKEIVAISQAHRKMRESFINNEIIQKINTKIKNQSTLVDKEIELNVELLSKNAWENSLMTYLNKVPFHFIGKGEQSIIKTELALSHKKTQEASIILMEEPENHLSYSKLNQLIYGLKKKREDKQLIISTHNNFVANKLGLENLILLNDNKVTRLNELSDDTKEYFEKLSGYDTLRLILCKKAILVEGASDELVVQKAYISLNNGRLPIEDEVDVISAGLSFLRFLEIAERINKKVAVVTDNDGNIDALKDKYNCYMGKFEKPNIRIFFDEKIEKGNIPGYNYNTLEPKLLKSNSLEDFNQIFNTEYKTDTELLKYMKNNKTKCALQIFKTDKEIKFPDYIVEAINWIKNVE